MLFGLKFLIQKFKITSKENKKSVFYFYLIANNAC